MSGEVFDRIPSRFIKNRKNKKLVRTSNEKSHDFSFSKIDETNKNTRSYYFKNAFSMKY
jgi:hypothetical protein